jgi:hypothetical protein
VGDDNIVWGNSLADDNIVWGNSQSDDNIVWGNDDPSVDPSAVLSGDVAPEAGMTLGELLSLWMAAFGGVNVPVATVN